MTRSTVRRRIGTAMLFAFLSLAVVGEAAARLITDRPAYVRGQTVRFTLINDSAKTIIWPSMSNYPTVWAQLPDGKEELVRELPAIVVAAIGMLEPGLERSWEWDQRDYHQWYDRQASPQDLRKPVPTGRYLARFPTSTHGTLETLPFRILNVTPVHPLGRLATTWARLKSARQ